MPYQPEDIAKCVIDAVNDIRPFAPGLKSVELMDDTVIFGEHGALDSIRLVHLIATIEELIEDRFNLVITLADQNAFSKAKSPFRTVRSLSEYVTGRVNEKA